MKRLVLLSFALMMTFYANAQFSKSPIFAKNDVINIDFNGDGSYFYNHNIRKGHTIYGLSKAFNIPVDDIFMSNNMTSSSTISVGDVIKIPIEPSKLIQSAYVPSAGVFVPVVYTVKPKETVFRISRMYFNQGIEDFKTRNNLKGNNLSIGQQVKIGWLPIYTEKGEAVAQPVTTTIVSTTPNPVATPNITTYTTTTTKVVRTTPTPPTTRDVEVAVATSRPISESDSVVAARQVYPAGFRPDLLGRAKYINGMTTARATTVAHWDDTIPDNGVAYALYNGAVPNSYIEIYNPNLKRSVKAKVIGSIPFGSYTSDVKLVISPRAAKMLGGLDRRFRVETKYIKK